MHATRRPAALLAAALLVVPALAGCTGGGSGSGGTGADSSVRAPAVSPSPFAGQSAREVLAAAQDAVDRATSVHMAGTVRDDGDDISLNLKIEWGKRAYGWVDLGGTRANVRVIGRRVYLKGDRKFWRVNGNAAAAQMFAGRWLQGSASTDGFDELVDLTKRSLVTDIFDTDNQVSRVLGKPVGGQATVGLRDHDADEPGNLYVAATGKPFPLLVESARKSDPGKVRFSQWNEPVTVTAPPRPIDIDRL